MEAGYKKIKKFTKLLEGISGYFNQIVKYFKAGIKEMYTKEDFFRDNPPELQEHFAFSWEKEYHLKEINRVRREEDAKRKEAELRLLKNLYDEGILTEEQYIEKSTPVKEKLNAMK